MTEGPNTLFLRIPKKNVLKEDEDTIMIEIDDARGFLEQLLVGFGNPHMAVVREGETDA